MKNHTKGRACRAMLSAIGLGVALSSCAVMTIDVDVYKGPLANHKDVQTEQIAVMAVGAKPLLERLKDNLCPLARRSVGKNSPKRWEVEKICPHVRTPQLMHNATYGSALGAANPDVVHLLESVEAALTLYKDKSEIDPKAELEKLLRDAREHLGNARSAFEDFKLTPRSTNEESVIADLDNIAASGVNTPKGKLAAAYSMYLSVQAEVEGKGLFRNWRGIMMALEDIVIDPRKQVGIASNELMQIENSLDDVWEGPRPYDSLRTKPVSKDSDARAWKQASSNRFFEVWARPDILLQQSVLLFKADVQRTRFIDAVGRTARGFNRTRKHAENLLITALFGLRELGALRIAVDRQYISPVDSVTLDSAIEEIASEIVVLVQARNLMFALRDDSQEGTALLSGLASHFNPYGNDGVTKAWVHALAQLLAKRPVKYSQALLEAHRRFKAKEFDLVVAKKFSTVSDKAVAKLQDKLLQHKARRQYGIARGPVGQRRFDDETVTELGQMLNVLGNIDVGVSFDWHRGRLDPGLFTLIEDFLRSQREQVAKPCKDHLLCEHGGTDTDVKRRLLHDALVRFAQKMLFVVNHESLFQTTSPTYTPNGNGEENGWNGGVAADTQTETYVRVLQTVGNSILVHIDAMRNEETHEKALVDAKPRALAAAGQVFGGTPHHGFAQINRAIQVRIGVADREIERLGAELQKIAAEKANAVDVERKAKVAVPGTKPAAPTADAKAAEALRDLMRTLGMMEPKSDAPTSVAGYREALAKALATQLAPTAFEVQLEAKLTKAAGAAATAGDSPRNTRLRQDIATFTKQAKPLLTSATAVNQGTLFATLQDGLAGKLSTLMNKVTAAKKADVDYKKAKVAHDAAKAKLKAVGDSETAKSGRKAKVEAERNGFVQARATVARHGQEAIVNAKTASLPVRQTLLQVLNANKSSDPAEYENAIALVGSLPPGLTIPDVNLRGNPNATARDVLDSLIAVLRYQHIDASRSADTKDVNELDTAKALVEAYRQRGDMIYIRPAVAYLRTSFAATTLQGNDVAWKNMLQRQGLQSGVPLLPDLFSQNNNDNKIINEIDKQFWQTINRVRVAGSGTTNYAIAKDDVGNWYVKNYSTDVGKIAESARKLAFFAGGGFVSPASSTPLTGAPGSASAPGLAPAVAQPKDPAEASALGKTFRKFEESYRAETLAAIKALRDEAKSYPTRIEAEWASGGVSKDIPKLKPAVAIVDGSDLKKLADQTDETIGGIAKGKESGALVGALRAVSSYYATALTKIDNANAEKPKAAKRILAQVVLENSLKKRISGAKVSVAKFENAIGVMGQF